MQSPSPSPIDDRMLAFLTIARALAKVKGKAFQKLNDTDLSVVYAVAMKHPNSLTHAELCDLIPERESSVVFRSIQRMTDHNVLAATIVPVKSTRKTVTKYSLGPMSKSQIRVWADQFDSVFSQS